MATETRKPTVLTEAAVAALLIASSLAFISGVASGSTTTEEPAAYLVAEGWPASVLSYVTVDGHRTVFYTFGGSVDIADVEVDSGGNYVVSESLGNEISRVTPSGQRTVICRFDSGANGLAIDTSGNYIITLDSEKIVRCTPTGTYQEIYSFAAGAGPLFFAIDSSGNYVVPESGSDKLSQVTPSGVRTIIYNFTPRTMPAAVAMDAAGNYIVNEFKLDVLSRISPEGARTVVYNFKIGTGAVGVSVDSSGNYIVCETHAHLISRITPDGTRTVIYQYTGSISNQEPNNLHIVPISELYTITSSSGTTTITTPAGITTSTASSSGLATTVSSETSTHATTTGTSETTATQGATSTNTRSSSLLTSTTSAGRASDYSLYAIVGVGAVAVVAALALLLRRRS